MEIFIAMMQEMGREQKFGLDDQRATLAEVQHLREGQEEAQRTTSTLADRINYLGEQLRHESSQRELAMTQMEIRICGLEANLEACMDANINEALGEILAINIMGPNYQGVSDDRHLTDVFLSEFTPGSKAPWVLYIGVYLNQHTNKDVQPTCVCKLCQTMVGLWVLVLFGAGVKQYA